MRSGTLLLIVRSGRVGRPAETLADPPLRERGCRQWRSGSSRSETLFAKRDALRAGATDTVPRVSRGDVRGSRYSDEIRLLEGHKTAPAVPGQVFVDAWRFADAGSPEATWDSGNPHAAALGFPDSRIDYVFVGMPALGLGRVVGVRRFGTAPVDGIWASDHFGVLAHIAAAGPA